MPEPMTRSERARQSQGFSSGSARSNTSWSEVAPAGYEHFPLLLRDHKGILRVPSGMPKKEFELLKKQIASTLTMLEATYAADDDEGQE